MKESTEIKVSTHVARDFLQNAEYFNTLPKVVWEYVSNSLDNAKEGGQPVNVGVVVLGSVIQIADDASGMSRKDLQNFFQMHAENRQRLRGKRVRGRFGTGKCAAFGIANCLRIDSSRKGKRNIVELRRSNILSARDGKPFPVQDILVDEATDQSDGTLVEVSDFRVKNLDIQPTIAYIERHLSRYHQRATVVINGQECQFEEPQVSEQFAFSPPPEVAKHIGDVKLIVKVALVPLDPETNGVDVLSNGIWHDTTLAGLEKKEMSQYLFGEVDVPVLEEEREWDVAPFDNTRNNALNVQNPVVAVLFGWIAQELEKARQRLVEAERTRKQSEEAKKLEKEASEIAKMLNEDFERLQMEFEFARLVASRQGKVKKVEVSGAEGVPLPGGGEVTTSWQAVRSSKGKGKGGRSPDSGKTASNGPDLVPGSQLGSPKSSTDGNQKRRRGLFHIEYKKETPERNRSRYDRDTRTIVINLDHPQIASAYNASGKNTESRQFLEISYEVAVVEYAQAIPFEKIEQAGEQYQASEALFDVGDTINRLSRRFAGVLSKPSRRNGQDETS
jgi:Histidine kinase-, DNA gyrase B-, and HSP90-like ATPase